VFIFFSNRLGCLGSLLVSALLTLVLILVFRHRWPRSLRRWPSHWRQASRSCASSTSIEEPAPTRWVSPAA